MKNDYIKNKINNDKIKKKNKATNIVAWVLIVLLAFCSTMSVLFSISLINGKVALADEPSFITLDKYYYFKDELHFEPLEPYEDFRDYTLICQATLGDDIPISKLLIRVYPYGFIRFYVNSWTVIYDYNNGWSNEEYRLIHFLSIDSDLSFFNDFFRENVEQVFDDNFINNFIFNLGFNKGYNDGLEYNYYNAINSLTSNFFDILTNISTFDNSCFIKDANKLSFNFNSQQNNLYFEQAFITTVSGTVDVNKVLTVTKDMLKFNFDDLKDLIYSYCGLTEFNYDLVIPITFTHTQSSVLSVPYPIEYICYYSIRNNNFLSYCDKSYYILENLQRKLVTERVNFVSCDFNKILIDFTVLNFDLAEEFNLPSSIVNQIKLTVVSAYENTSIAYNNGYNQGYSNGYRKGVDDNADYSFTGLLTSVVDVPVQTLSSLFNFDFLGFNLWNFFTAILTIVVVVFIIKLVL